MPHGLHSLTFIYEPQTSKPNFECSYGSRNKLGKNHILILVLSCSVIVSFDVIFRLNAIKFVYYVCVL